MGEITNANDVRLTVESNSNKVQFGKVVRVLVQNFSFTFSEDNQLKSGVGHRSSKSYTRGNRTKELSFEVEGDDKELLDTVVSDGDEFVEFDFTAISPEVDVDASGILTELEYSGDDGEATVWSAEGVAWEGGIE